MHYTTTNNLSLIEKQIKWFLNKNDEAIQTNYPLTENAKPANIKNNSNFATWFGDSKVVDLSGDPLVVYHGTSRSFEEFGSWGSNSHHPSSYLGGWFCDDIDVSSTFMNDVAGYKDNANLVPCYLRITKPYLFEVDPKELKQAEELEKILNKITNLIQDHMMNSKDEYTNGKNYIKLQDMINKYISIFPEDDKIKDIFYLEQDELYDEMENIVFLFIDRYNKARKEHIKLENNDPWQNMYTKLRHYISGDNSTNDIGKGAEKFVNDIQKQGYDGIILYGTSADHPHCNGTSNQYVIFNPNQAKSIYNNGNYNPNTAKISETQKDNP